MTEAGGADELFCGEGAGCGAGDDGEADDEGAVEACDFADGGADGGAAVKPGDDGADGETAGETGDLLCVEALKFKKFVIFIFVDFLAFSSGTKCQKKVFFNHLVRGY